MSQKENLLQTMLEIIQQNPGIRPKELNKRLGREHSAQYRQTLIDRGLVRKEKDGVAVRYYPVAVHNVHMLRIFTDSQGKFGDLASVVIDEGKHINNAERRAITRKLGTGETIFINDVANVNTSIMHYDGELDFAGVAALAGAWLLTKLQGKPIQMMRSKAGVITTWQASELTWIRASLSAMPPWNHRELESVEAVEQITPDKAATMEHTMAWAWIDEAKGFVRARTFASDWGIPEAQGNGSGAMMLAAMLGRKLKIKHGEGSVIFAKPAKDNYADIGGRVVEDE